VPDLKRRCQLAGGSTRDGYSKRLFGYRGNVERDINFLKETRTDEGRKDRIETLEIQTG